MNIEKSREMVAAAAKGDATALREALEHGADLHFDQDLALRTAAACGHMACLRLLVESGASVSAHDHEALLLAVLAEDTAMVDYLQERGADISIVMKLHDKKIDAAARSFLEKLSARDSFNKSFENQSFISGLAHAHRKMTPGLKPRSRPPGA